MRRFCRSLALGRLSPRHRRQQDGRDVAPGTAIAVGLSPAAADAGLRFKVRAGERADPAAPSTITLVGIGRRPTFVNTGVRFLNRFDWFYDADKGVVGYRPVGR